MVAMIALQTAQDSASAPAAGQIAQHPLMQYLLMAMGFAFLGLMGLLSLLLLYLMFRGKINLSTLLDEANGDASMSRFQLLLFSLVVSVGLFLYMLNNLTLPDIPASVLILLGISSSTYAASKGIQFSRVEGLMKPNQVPPDGPPQGPPSGDATN